MKLSRIPLKFASTSTGIELDKKRTFSQKLFDILFAPPNPKESIIQWLLRQFIVADSSGEPSWTLTFALIVVAYAGIAVVSQVYIGLSPVITYDAAGHILSTQLKGFTAEFWVFLITMFTAIAYIFRQRNKDKINAQNLEDGTIPPELGGGTATSLIDAIKNILDKFKTK